MPHRATPATLYHSLPKDLPRTSRDPDTHDRVRHDRIDDSGVITLRHHGHLHHIGIGGTHARTHVIMLIQDLNIRVIAATTGELPRELTVDPTRDYQPEGRRNPQTHRFGGFRCPEASHGAGDGNRTRAISLGS